MQRGNFEGEGRQYRDTLRSSVQKQVNRSRCRLGYGIRWTVGIVLDGGPEALRDVVIATNFDTQFAITGFVGYNFCCMIASDTLFDARGWVFADRVSKGRCCVNQFWD